MKEHPDYKYRPRRKPKPLMKKEPKFGFSMSPLLPPTMENHNLQRSLMTPISTSSGVTSILNPDSDHLKLSRSLFPPLPYLYHPFRHPDESKFAAELALLYRNNPLYPPNINWHINNIASQNLNGANPCNMCPPTFSRRSPSPEQLQRPVCVIMKSEEFRNEPAHVIWKPLPVLPDRLNHWFSDIASLATSSSTVSSTATSAINLMEYRDNGDSGRDSSSPCNQ